MAQGTSTSETAPADEGVPNPAKGQGATRDAARIGGEANPTERDVVERNKEIVRRIEAAWNAHDLDTLDQYFSPDVVGNASVPYLPKALEGWKRAHLEMTEAYPDRQHFIEDMIAEGDKVVVRCRLVGTNTGGIHWLDVPPNGEPVDMQWICIYRLVDGKVVETWSFNDMLMLVRQMGADPALVVARVLRGGWPLLVSD